MADLMQSNQTVQQTQIGQSSESQHKLNTMEDLGTSKVLCTHDGVLLRKISAEHIADLNNSGALSLVEYTTAKRLYLEWNRNESIVITDDSQDQGGWAVVDAISKRTRTNSECRVFKTKSVNNDANGSASNSVSSSVGSDGWAVPVASRVIRTPLQELSHIVIKERGQTFRCIRKSDGSVHSEYFFQHGNADQFVRSMRHLHVIDHSGGRHAEEYIILNSETQKLKKTFAELDIGEIKASSLHSESWLPSKVVGFLVNIPDYVQPSSQRTLKTRPRSMENYDMLSSTTQMNRSSDNSSASERDSSNTSPSSVFTDKLEAIQLYKLPIRKIIKRGAPLNESQWMEFLTTDGRILEEERVREIIFRGGLEHNLRSEVWKYLLNFYKWTDSAVERLQYREQKSREYYTMKVQWLSMTATQEANFDGYRERKNQIEKDVKRTDRTTDFFAGEENPNLVRLQGILMTYVMYNFDLGYVQGMSDLLAPILTIMENEVDAFWCFVGFMDMVFGNFDIDQAGIKSQFSQLRSLLKIANPRLFQHIVTHDSDNMYFCFRWLLVWYKREFTPDDVLKLWECLWTRLPCPNFHLFISIAILDQEADTIIEKEYEFTEILKHVNELSENIDLERILALAEAIYYQIKSAENLTNEIRAIIGEPLIETEYIDTPTDTQDFEDGFAELTKELNIEEQQRKEQLLEEACERSMFLQYT